MHYTINYAGHAHYSCASSRSIMQIESHAFNQLANLQRVLLRVRIKNVQYQQYSTVFINIVLL